MRRVFQYLPDIYTTFTHIFKDVSLGSFFGSHDKAAAYYDAVAPMDVDDDGDDSVASKKGKLPAQDIHTPPSSPAAVRVKKNVTPLEMDSINNNPCMATILAVSIHGTRRENTIMSSTIQNATQYNIIQHTK